MASTGRTLSPGGALLRASRMFSLPSALPPPPGDFQAATSYKSGTATQTFPTLQTVTSPDNFRQRGDWGFKRNFPLRSTARTSTPYLRIKQVDSIEHVTDFNSAADHTLTLEKFQEMNVFISLPHPKKATSEGQRYLGFKDSVESVFEDKYDFTALDEDKIKEAGQRRWKYKGPWLANLSEGEFQAYIKKQVRGRKTEFREFLKVQIAPALTIEARKHAMEQGVDQEVPDVRPEDVTKEQIMAFLRKSRENRGKLYDHVSKFLDLAPCENTDYVQDMTPGESREFSADDPYSKIGPPVTHPSAGLSYLRTNAFLENHPVYGPQAESRPVKARVMLTNTENSYVGVGGFIAQFDANRMAYKTTGSTQYDYKVPGGPKTWVSVASAHVNSTGQAVMHLVKPDVEARMIQEEMQGERRLFHQQTEESASAHLALKGRGSADYFTAPRPSKSMRASNSIWKIGNIYGLGAAPRRDSQPTSPEDPEW